MTVPSYPCGLNVLPRLLSSLNPERSEQIKALLNPLKSLRDTGESVPYIFMSRKFHDCNELNYMLSCTM